MSTIRTLSGLICSPWVRMVELDHPDNLVGCYCAVQHCESCTPAAFTWQMGSQDQHVFESRLDVYCEVGETIAQTYNFGRYQGD